MRLAGGYSRQDRRGAQLLAEIVREDMPIPRLTPAARYRPKSSRTMEPDAGMPHVRFCAGGAQ
jgi:hypothetical protein